MDCHKLLDSFLQAVPASIYLLFNGWNGFQCNTQPNKVLWPKIKHSGWYKLELHAKSDLFIANKSYIHSISMLRKLQVPLQRSPYFRGSGLRVPKETVPFNSTQPKPEWETQFLLLRSKNRSIFILALILIRLLCDFCKLSTNHNSLPHCTTAVQAKRV